MWYEELLKICVLKDFVLEPVKELGSGAFGKVFKTATGYAAKCIAKSLLNSPEKS